MNEPLASYADLDGVVAAVGRYCESLGQLNFMQAYEGLSLPGLSSPARAAP